MTRKVQREQGSDDNLKFCRAGAVTMEEKKNYAVEMILLDPQGREITRSDKLGKPAPEFVAEVSAAVD